MSAVIRSRRLTLLGLIVALSPALDPMGRIVPMGAECRAQYEQPADVEMPLPDQEPDGEMIDEGPSRRPRAGRSKSARRGGRRPSTNAASKAKAPAKPQDSSEPRFSRDVAPILVGNCVGCHTGDGDGLRKSKLDLSSFEKLMAGTPDHKVIVPGKPRESHLYLRIHGDETPRMPLDNDRTLSDATVAKIERWIKAGAALDAGLDKSAAFQTYAATPEDLRRLELGKLSAEERDKKAVEVGQSRFAQANPKLKPETTPGEHFLLFANLPGERAAQAVKALESQHGKLKRLLGAGVMERPEKVSVYVFNDRKDLIEFVRTVEKRDVGTTVQATARLAVPQPYIAVLDPSLGKEESSPPHRRRGGRSKKGDEGASAAVNDRSLAGLITEALATGAVEAAGKPPAWLSSGIGAYVAGRLDPRSAEIQKLRAAAAELGRTNWNLKAAEILADSPDSRPEDVRAVGYAIVEWLLSPELGRAFPAFVAGIIKDPADLTGILKSVYDTDRDQFLSGSGEWMAERFGNLP